MQFDQNRDCDTFSVFKFRITEKPRASKHQEDSKALRKHMLRNFPRNRIRKLTISNAQTLESLNLQIFIKTVFYCI